MNISGEGSRLQNFARAIGCPFFWFGGLRNPNKKISSIITRQNRRYHTLGGNLDDVNQSRALFVPPIYAVTRFHYTTLAA
jgi:hypothetical protein